VIAENCSLGYAAEEKTAKLRKRVARCSANRSPARIKPFFFGSALASICPSKSAAGTRKLPGAIPINALMGMIMQKYRGKIEGKKVAEIINKVKKQ